MGIANGSKDRRGMLREYLEDERESGHSLRSTLTQADTGALPELEETTEVRIKEMGMAMECANSMRTVIGAYRRQNAGRHLMVADTGDSVSTICCK